MMGKTSIQWTDHSINPIRAHNKTTGDLGHYCEAVSPGCKFCYADRTQPRFRMPHFPPASARHWDNAKLATAGDGDWNRLALPLAYAGNAYASDAIELAQAQPQAQPAPAPSPPKSPSRPNTICWIRWRR